MSKSRHKAVGQRVSATPPRAAVSTQAANRLDLERWLFRSAALSGALLWLVLAWPAVQGRLHVVGDLGGYHLPMRMAFADCLARGEQPYWTNRIFCGYYLHGEGQVGMLHPWHQLLYRVFPLAAAFEIELLISYPLLLVGMWLWFRRLGLPSAAALFGALVFTYSGFSLLHLNHMNLVAVLAHLPWLLLAIDVALRSTSRTHVWLAGGAVSLLLASQVLLGHPQTVWLSGLLIAGYVLWLYRSWASRLRPAIVGVALVLGFLMGAAQWWPTWDALAGSQRETATAADRSIGSLHPINLLQGVAPYALAERVWTDDPLNAGTHELSCYAGALVPALCAWLLLCRGMTPARRHLIIAAAVLAGCGLLLALGKYSGPVAAALSRVPIVGSFRVPARALMFVYLGGALASAVALAELTQRAAAGTRVAWPRLAWLAAVPVASALALVALALIPPPQISASHSSAWSAPDAALSLHSSLWWTGGAAGVVLSAAAVALVAAAARGFGWALLLVPVLAAIDLGIYGESYNSGVQPPLTLAEIAATSPACPNDPLWRVVTSQPRSNLPALRGGRTAFGYAGLIPERRLLDNPLLVSDHADLVRRLVAGQWYLNGRQLIELPAAIPRVRLLSRWRVSSDRDRKAANNLATDLIADDPALVVLLDAPPPGASDGGGDGDGQQGRLAAPGFAGRVAIVLDQPGNLVLEVNSSVPQLLVLSESWHAGWRAEIASLDAGGAAASQPSAAGSAPLSIARAYGDFMACEVPAGKHRVALRFAPDSLRRGAMLSLAAAAASLLVTGAGLAVARFRPRKLPSN